jgi:hypothetical protein
MGLSLHSMTRARRDASRITVHSRALPLSSHALRRSARTRCRSARTRSAAQLARAAAQKSMRPASTHRLSGSLMIVAPLAQRAPQMARSLATLLATSARCAASYRRTCTVSARCGDDVPRSACAAKTTRARRLPEYSMWRRAWQVPRPHSTRLRVGLIAPCGFGRRRVSRRGGPARAERAAAGRGPAAGTLATRAALRTRGSIHCISG